jgi:hypothetical protein
VEARVFAFCGGDTLSPEFWNILMIIKGAAHSGAILDGN